MTLYQGAEKIISQLHMLVDFEYLFFCVNLLTLKFGTHNINIEMISSQKFHGKKILFQPLEYCQSWQ